MRANEATAEPEQVRALPERDAVWQRIRGEAGEVTREEPAMTGFIRNVVLDHGRLESALSYHLAHKLGTGDLPANLVQQVMEEAFTASPAIGHALRADLQAVLQRDPACKSLVQALLYFKGFHALQSYRAANWLWGQGSRHLALFLQSRMSELFGVDIHPEAKIGQGILMDHATSIVIGQTAVVEDDVSILHGVTLGGTGKEAEDRHPKIRYGVLIGAGAKILGNIEVGECARVAAGSVVLKPVPAHCTVAGVPAKVIGCAGCDHPSEEMNHLVEETPAP